MNRYQREAIDRHCRLAIETLCAPKYVREGLSVVLSVNSGYE